MARTKKVNISAISGRYVTNAYAKARPNNVVRMTVKLKKCK